MRLDKLRQALAEQELDALLVSQPHNLRYLSGFTPTAPGDGYLLITPQDALVATDFRYYEQCEQQAPGYRLCKITARFPQLLSEMIAQTGAKRVGFESQDVSYDLYQTWTQATEGTTWVPTKGLVEALRMTKDADELDAIRRAVALSDAAVEHLAQVIKPGMTEREVSWELEAYMRTHGAEDASFTIIVASGPNGAMCHAVTSDRRVEAGEPIVMDLGARVDGYCSDLTRTFCIGAPKDDQYLKIWNIVLQAQQAAAAAIHAGMLGREADAVARQVITEAGYGEYFGHGLGHGVGLAIHEKPSAGRLSEDTLLPGAVITIEPGIYIPGWGGVRIEDMGVVTETGIEVFTRASKIAQVG